MMQSESPKPKIKRSIKDRPVVKQVCSFFNPGGRRQSTKTSTTSPSTPADQPPRQGPSALSRFKTNVREKIHSMRESIPVEATVYRRDGKEIKIKRPSLAQFPMAVVSGTEKMATISWWYIKSLRQKEIKPSEAEVILQSGKVVQVNKRTIERARRSFAMKMAAAFPSLYGVKKQEVIDFSRNLATLLESGLPILQALQILHRQAKKGRFKQVLEKMMEDLEQGDTLSEACAKHPGVFGTFYVRLIRVGEETGNMETVLRSLVKQMKKEQALQAKLKSSMAYPSFIMALSFGVIALLVLFVLPTFVNIYTGMGQPVPVMLRVCVGAGDFGKQYAIVLLMCAVAAGVFLVYYTSKTVSGIRVKDTFMMKTPVLGKVVLHGRLARLSNNMAILLSAGIPLTEGFHLMIQGSDSVLMKEALTEVNVKIHAGESLSTAMQTQRVFPLLFTQMVEVGEMTGRLETNLEIVGAYYEEEADKSMSKMVATLGPGMMLFIGVTVGTLVITMFSSLYGMYGAIGG